MFFARPFVFYLQTERKDSSGSPQKTDFSKVVVFCNKWQERNHRHPIPWAEQIQNRYSLGLYCYVPPGWKPNHSHGHIQKCFSGFINLKSAFDVIHRSLPWEKFLKNQSSHKRLFCLIESLYSKNSLQARCDLKGELIEVLIPTWGGTHGYVLTPTSFNLFINDPSCQQLTLMLESQFLLRSQYYLPQFQIWFTSFNGGLHSVL